MLRSFLGLLLLTWLSSYGLILGLHKVNPQPSYNCLSSSELRVPLHGHPFVDVPIFPTPPSTSPSERYAIGRYALTSNPGRFHFYIQDQQTERSVFFKPITDRTPTRYYWSPDEQGVFFFWSNTFFEGALLSVGGEEPIEIRDGIVGFPLGWSADSRYFATAVRFNRRPTIFTYDSLTHTRHDFPLAETTGNLYAFAWSPTENKLAYITSYQIAIVDLGTGSASSLVYRDNTQYSPINIIKWSADGKALIYGYMGEMQHLFVFDDQLQEIASLTFPYSSQTPLPYLTEDDGALMYFREGSGHYEMWRFDMASGLQEQMLSDISAVDLNGEQLALLRDVGSRQHLEIRQADGSQPLVIGSYPSAYLSLAWRNKDAPVLMVWNLDRSMLNIIDPAGNVLWSLPPYQQFNFINTESTADDERFIALATPTLVMLFDTQTRQGYRLPAELYASLPSALFDPNVTSQIQITPSPDGQLWLVEVVGGRQTSLYRLRPAANEWRLLDTASEIYNLLWSPNGERFVFYKSAAPLEKQVIAMSADGRQQWHLGELSGFSAYQWAKCGGLWSALRGE